MDLSLTPEDIAFRDEVRAFLDEKLTPDLRAWGQLTRSFVGDVEIGKRWQKIVHAKGWGAPAWPVEHGGTGWTAMQRYIFERESAAARAPKFFNMGIRMVGPVIMKFGTPAQKAQFLPATVGAEIMWCQGYSEPGSGSDLASLQTRAERDGDHYVINGSKIWTTLAHYADWMFCLVRTNRDVKQQDGISFVLIDMKTPGLSIRPIITLAGDHEVNQVFFDNVRVPIANRVGEENKGWTVAKYLLEFERGGIYSPNPAEILEMADEACDTPALTARTAQTRIANMALEYTEKRVFSSLTTGGSTGALSSLLKIRGTELTQAASEIAMDANDLYALVDQPDALTPVSNAVPLGQAELVTATYRHLNNRAASIYGGSNEIQRNIIAKAVLGL
ncbi:acyl-CoA dehydrogenase family protein [Desertibaculum subflavum]|uniref:acyl-CoA dehydrogenase family protein n=1 Tax=Desertibaculum subflavum TaxID=2268458 RepID=UPI000E661C68